MHNSWTVAGIFLCLVALATSGSSSMTATLLDRTSLRRGSEGEKGQCHVPAESQSNLLSMGMSMVARLRGGGKGVLSVKNKEEFDNAIKGAEMAVCEF